MRIGGKSGMNWIRCADDVIGLQPSYLNAFPPVIGAFLDVAASPIGGDNDADGEYKISHGLESSPPRQEVSAEWGYGGCRLRAAMKLFGAGTRQTFTTGSYRV